MKISVEMNIEEFENYRLYEKSKKQLEIKFKEIIDKELANPYLDKYTAQLIKDEIVKIYNCLFANGDKEG